MPARQNKQKILERFKKAHGNKYDYSLIGNFKNMAVKLPIKCKKHDIIFYNTANSHIYRGGCKKCGTESRSKSIIALKKSQFITKVSKIHNNKYGYKKVNYTGRNNKVIITCNEHGDFNQVAKDHLEGAGCPRCGMNGFKKSDFIKKCKNNNALLYVIECYNDEEEFIKIGITSKEYTPDRFNNKAKMPYHYIVICEIRGIPEDIYNKEKELHRKFKQYKYKPLIKFSGSSECFRIESKN